MNNELVKEKNSAKHETVKRGPGAKLKSAREAQHYSVADVAANIHLTTTLVSDLENDNYGKGMSLVFIRGYLRSYAKFLGLSPDEIVHEFDQLGIPDKLSKITNTNIIFKPHREMSDHLVPWVGGLVVLIVVLLGVIWWHTEKNGLLGKTEVATSNDQVTNSVNSNDAEPNIASGNDNNVVPNTGYNQGSQSDNPVNQSLDQNATAPINGNIDNNTNATLTNNNINNIGNGPVDPTATPAQPNTTADGTNATGTNATGDTTNNTNTTTTTNNNNNNNSNTTTTNNKPAAKPQVKKYAKQQKKAVIDVPFQ